MATQIYLVCLLVCFLTMANCLNQWEIDNKFSEIDNRLDAIDNDLERLDSLVAEIRPEESSMDEADENAKVIPPVTLLEARRQHAGDSVIFYIMYKPNVDDIQIKYADYNQHDPSFEPVTIDIPVPVGYLMDGLREAHIATPLVEGSYAIVEVRFQARSPFQYRLDLQMFHGPEEYMQETNITMPFLKIQPAGDLVYDGQDIDVKLTVPYEGIAMDYPGTSGSITETALIDPDSGVMVHSDPPTDMTLFEIVDDKWVTEDREIILKIKTSQNKTSGLIVFSSYKSAFPIMSLLSQVRLLKTVILRPSTQDGPYPEGYMNFIIEDGETVENGTVQKGCLVGEECVIECEAVGAEIMELLLEKIEGDGSRTNVGNGSVSGASNFIYGKKVGEVLPAVSVGEETYECLVRNAQGTSKTRTVQVIYSVGVEILGDQSGVRVVEENGTLRRVAISCTVRGNPVPNIAFALNYVTSYEPDVVPDELVTQGEETVATKFVTFDTSDPNCQRGDYKGRLVSVTCTAQGVGEHHTSTGFDYLGLTNLTEDIGK